MNEVVAIKQATEPDEILFVVDAMTGQDAVNTAKAFNDRLDIDGVVLTKLDGDTRGGAALSIRSVVEKPIKFAGTGEKLDALTEFYPDRMAQRILGMGDVVSFVEKAQEQFDEAEAEKLQRKFRSQEFDLQDFYDQLQKIKNMGSLKDLLGMIPGVGKAVKQIDVDDDAFRHIEALIQSMTPYERATPDAINGCAPPPHRGRRRHGGPGRQRAPEAVPRDEEDDEDDVQAPGQGPLHRPQPAVGRALAPSSGSGFAVQGSPAPTPRPDEPLNPEPRIMSVKLRFRRMGRRKAPVFGLVATDSRSPRDGRFIEDLGRYAPVAEPSTFTVDAERVIYWLNQGAQPSDTVRNLLQKEGVLLQWALTRQGKEAEEIETAVNEFQERRQGKTGAVKKTRAERRAEALQAERASAKEKAAEMAKQRAELEAALEKQREEAEAAARAEAEEARTAAAAAAADSEALTTAADDTAAPAGDAAPQDADASAETASTDAAGGDSETPEAAVSGEPVEQTSSQADGDDDTADQKADAEAEGGNAAVEAASADAVSDEAPDAAEEQPAATDATSAEVAADAAAALADQTEAGAEQADTLPRPPPRTRPTPTEPRATSPLAPRRPLATPPRRPMPPARTTTPRRSPHGLYPGGAGTRRPRPFCDPHVRTRRPRPPAPDGPRRPPARRPRRDQGGPRDRRPAALRRPRTACSWAPRPRPLASAPSSTSASSTPRAAPSSCCRSTAPTPSRPPRTLRGVLRLRRTRTTSRRWQRARSSCTTWSV